MLFLYCDILHKPNEKVSIRLFDCKWSTICNATICYINLSRICQFRDWSVIPRQVHCVCFQFYHDNSYWILQVDLLKGTIPPIFEKGNILQASITHMYMLQSQGIYQNGMQTHSKTHREAHYTYHNGFRFGYSCETQLIVTLYNWMQIEITNIQVYMTIFDFSNLNLDLNLNIWSAEHPYTFTRVSLEYKCWCSH